RRKVQRFEQRMMPRAVTVWHRPRDFPPVQIERDDRAVRRLEQWKPLGTDDVAIARRERIPIAEVRRLRIAGRDNRDHRRVDGWYVQTVGFRIEGAAVPVGAANPPRDLQLTFLAVRPLNRWRRVDGPEHVVVGDPSGFLAELRREVDQIAGRDPL